MVTISSSFRAAVVAAFTLTLTLLAQNPTGSREQPDNGGTDEDADELFERVRWVRDRRANPEGDVPAEAYLEAHKALDRMLAAEAQLRPHDAAEDRWTFIGPRPLQALTTPQAIFSGARSISGRVTALAIDPRDGDVIYLGAATGGVWKTVDGGRNWIPLTDDQPTLVVGAIALDPSNPDTVYVGTGELLTGFYGSGVLKSTDGGASWTQLTGPFVGPFNTVRSGAVFGALAVSPANPQLILAGVDYGGGLAARGGIYRSADGGVTWTQVLAGGAGTDLVFNPAQPNIVYAGVANAALRTAFARPQNGLYKSTDGGATWTQLWNSGPNALPAANLGRISLALARSAPNTLYAAIQDSSPQRFGRLLGFFRTQDGGDNWTPLLNTPDFCTPQCWYAMPIAVHPANPNLVLAGGLFLFRSLNGGASWNNIYVGQNGDPIHVDFHAITFTPDLSKTFVGTDGGVFVTSGITQQSVNWSDRNETLGTIQFYPGISLHPSDPNITLGGTQDNGTLLYTGNPTWDEILGGDGGYSAIDFGIPDILYGSLPRNVILKAGLGSYQSFITSRHGIDPLDRSQFLAPLVIDPNNPLRLYYGTFRLYQTNDGAGRWRAISSDLTRGPDTGGSITAIAPAPSESAVVYAGTSDGLVQVTTSADRGPDAEWVDRSATLPRRPVGSIAIDPVSDSTAYVAYQGFSGFGNDEQGHIFKTTDRGESWTDISGNLPNIPVSALAIDPDVPDTVYAGTDIGVFVTRDGGASWSTLVNGFPRVFVMDLVVHRPTRILRAATHGRGMWDLQLPPVASQRPVITALSQTSAGAGAAGFTLTVTGRNFAPGTTLRWNGTVPATGIVRNTQLLAAISTADLAGAGRATVMVFSPAPGGGLSNAVTFTVGAPPAIAPGGLINGANLLGASVLSPGSTATLYGTNLAYGTAEPGAPPLPLTLGDVSVELDNLPVPLLYVSPTQIIFQVPWGFLGETRAFLAVFNGTQKSATLPVKLAAFAPALFSTNQKGTGQGNITIEGAAGVLAAPVDAFPNSRPASGQERGSGPDLRHRIGPGVGHERKSAARWRAAVRCISATGANSRGNNRGRAGHGAILGARSRQNRRL